MYEIIFPSKYALNITVHNVGSLISRLWKSWEGKKPSGNSVGWQFMSSRALEADHRLRLFVTVWNIVRVVTDMLLSRVGQPLVTRGLIGYTFGTLQKKPGSRKYNK